MKWDSSLNDFSITFYSQFSTQLRIALTALKSTYQVKFSNVTCVCISRVVLLTFVSFLISIVC